MKSVESHAIYTNIKQRIASVLQGLTGPPAGLWPVVIYASTNQLALVKNTLNSISALSDSGTGPTLYPFIFSGEPKILARFKKLGYETVSTRGLVSQMKDERIAFDDRGQFTGKSKHSLYRQFIDLEQTKFEVMALVAVATVAELFGKALLINSDSYFINDPSEDLDLMHRNHDVSLLFSHGYDPAKIFSNDRVALSSSFLAVFEGEALSYIEKLVTQYALEHTTTIDDAINLLYSTDTERTWPKRNEGGFKLGVSGHKWIRTYDDLIYSTFYDVPFGLLPFDKYPNHRSLNKGYLSQPLSSEDQEGIMVARTSLNKQLPASIEVLEKKRMGVWQNFPVTKENNNSLSSIILKKSAAIYPDEPLPDVENEKLKQSEEKALSLIGKLFANTKYDEVLLLGHYNSRAEELGNLLSLSPALASGAQLGLGYFDGSDALRMKDELEVYAKRVKIKLDLTKQRPLDTVLNKTVLTKYLAERPSALVIMVLRTPRDSIDFIPKSSVLEKNYATFDHYEKRLFQMYELAQNTEFAERIMFIDSDMLTGIDAELLKEISLFLGLKKSLDREKKVTQALATGAIDFSVPAAQISESTRLNIRVEDLNIVLNDFEVLYRDIRSKIIENTVIPSKLDRHLVNAPPPRPLHASNDVGADFNFE